MRSVWLTDIHLEFLVESQLARFFDDLRACRADSVLISGDIAQAPSIGTMLARLEERLETPIYFVLGNHDFYRGSIAAVRTAVQRLCERSRYLRWLSTDGVVRLTETICLVGHDGWGDARLGDFSGSQVQLNDFVQIAELTRLPRTQLQARLQQLGDEAATHLQTVLPQALAAGHHVVVLTHVPPFQEACWHEGSISAPDWLPFFSCKAVGDVLIAAARDRPDRRMTILCGHTHSSGRTQILPNLTVRTGAVTYGRPVIQEIFEWD